MRSILKTTGLVPSLQQGLIFYIGIPLLLLIITNQYIPWQKIFYPCNSRANIHIPPLLFPQRIAWPSLMTTPYLSQEIFIFYHTKKCVPLNYEVNALFKIQL